jgi:hypothetical protein
MNSQRRTHLPAGHTLIELVAATVSSAILLAGLGSVMLITRQIAYTPSASTSRIDASNAINRLADELRFATLITEHSQLVLEFVVADRTGDGAAERIRYQWSGTPGTPLERSVNSAAPTSVLEQVETCSFTLQSSGSPPVVSYVKVQLQSGTRSDPLVPLPSHSRVDAAVEILAFPELLSAYWRANFDLGDDPITLEVNDDGTLDWLRTGGEYRTNPVNDFTGVTVIEARCRDTSTAAGAAVIRINADRQAGSWGSIGVKVEKQLDGSQRLTLFQGASDTTLRIIDNLSADPVRIRLAITPSTDAITLHVNDEDIGSLYSQTYSYTPYSPTGSQRYVAVTDDPTAEFKFIEVRTTAN